MTSTVVDAPDRSACADAVAGLRSAVDALLALQVTTLPGLELVALAGELEEQTRRLQSVDAGVLASVASTGAFHEVGRAGVVDLLVSGLRVDPARARARANRSQELAARVALTGELLEPLLPVAAAALNEGLISGEHCTVIADALEQIPATAAVELTDLVETTLVRAAQFEDPRLLRRTARILLDRIDPDGPEPRDDENDRLRALCLTIRADGSGQLKGRLSAETALVWQTILDTLSAPAAGDDGEPDARSATQRRHDALHEAGLRILRSGTLPDCGGMPATVLIRTTPSDLARPGGANLTDHDTVLTTRLLDRLVPDGQLIPMRTNESGAVLQHGRAIRLATAAQRRALAVREVAAASPGAHVPRPGARRTTSGPGATAGVPIWATWCCSAATTTAASTPTAGSWS